MGGSTVIVGTAIVGVLAAFVDVAGTLPGVGVLEGIAVPAGFVRSLVGALSVLAGTR